MRTTLNLESAVLDEVMKLSKSRNRSEAVRIALLAYINQENKQALLAMRGKLKINQNWRLLRDVGGVDND